MLKGRSRVGAVDRGSARLSALSAVATAALVALAIGAPVAFASGMERGTTVVAADPTATDTATASATASDTSSAVPTASPTASPSATVTPSPSPSSTLNPGAVIDPSTSASPTATVTRPTGTILPDLQSLVAWADLPLSDTAAYAATNLQEPITYSITPALPEGLVLSASTGVISGTPTTAQTPIDYVVTATETPADGELASTAIADVTIWIRPRLAPRTQSFDLVTGAEMTPSPAMEPHGFRDPVLFTIEPALPQSLDFSTATGAISGIPDFIQGPTTYVISGTDGRFTATAEVTVAVTCGDPATAPLDCPRPLLMLGGADPAAPLVMAATNVVDPIHGPYSVPASDKCATCHRTHSAKSSTALSFRVGSVTSLCLSCHNGTGAPAQNVQAEYDAASSGGVTQAGYSHNIPATVSNPHSTAVVDADAASIPANEFAGTANRHAECTDCHNPHSSFTTPISNPVLSGTTDSGWSASGYISGVSGVAVTNGAAGSVPTYTFLDGAVAPMTREYQLCFKCHSSFTRGPTGATDLGIQFNPANASFHPVEGPGKNTSQAMTNNLADATSNSYKKWTFTTGETVRCTHCHANGTKTITDSQGKSRLVPTDPHAAPVPSPLTATANRRSILLANYDRDTANPGSFTAGNYALCFTCHSTQPFTNANSTATNFQYHQKHAGKANCSECHYRLHSTATSVTPNDGSTVTTSGSRLVSFPPDVSGVNGRINFTAKNGNTSGSCTLNCHGKEHTPKTY